MRRTNWLGLLVLGLTLLSPTLGQAGPELATFPWQVAPFCNVVTLTVIQDGPGFSLSGFDDNCGAAHSAAYGSASFNPDGTVALGLTVLGANGAAEQFSVVLTAASGFSGTWQDASGNTGDFLLNPALPAPGTPRPAPAVNGALLLLGSVTNGALAAGAVTGDKLPAAVDGSRVLDTIDSVALELRVNGERALRIEPATLGTLVAPNVIGGSSTNSVTPGKIGATIAGGGAAGDVLFCTPPCANSVTNGFGTVGGGRGNTAGSQATVAGGISNTASAPNSTVGGGAFNTASGPEATVSGGLSNTASQNHATASGGHSNTASGPDSTVGGGTGNTATAQDATVPGGSSAVAGLFGQMAYASGQFAATGDAQTSLFVLRNTTTTGAQTELFLDGGSRRIALAAGRTMTFDILVAARSTTGQSAGYQILGVIENDGGTTNFVGTPTVTALGEDVTAWDVAVVNDSPNGALAIKVTGAASTSIRWVAVVRTAEVSQ